MELRSFVRIMIRRWWIIAAFFIVTMAVAAAVSFTQTPVYRTWATFVVSPTAVFQDSRDFVYGLDTLSRRDGVVATYTEIFSSHALFEIAVERLGLTPSQASGIQVSSSVIVGTNVIKIEIQGSSPETIKALADVLGEAAIEYSQALYEFFTLKPLDSARVPKWPASPNKTQNLMLAAVLGVTLGAGLAFLVDYLRGPVEARDSLSIFHSETGAYNKQYFLQRLGEEISRAKRSERPVSLALLHIERLDMIQNTPFSKSRSEALRQVTVFLKQNLREEDLVAYLDDDRFVFLLPDTSGSQAKRHMAKLQKRIEWSVFELAESGLKLNLSSTCGLVSLGPDAMNRDELLAKAQEALQNADLDGHGGVYLIEQVDENKV